MVESQDRREGIFLVLKEDIAWERRRQAVAIDLSNAGILDYLRYQDYLVKTYGTGRIERDAVLSTQRQEAMSLFRGFQQETLRASDIFDIPLLARYLAVLELWSAFHGTDPEDSVFYYNPLTAKLEPVGFDNKPQPEPGESLLTPQRELFRRALEEPEVAAAYVSELERVSSKAYLSELKSAIGESLEANMKALHREWPGLELPWGDIRQRQRFLRAFLKPPRLVQAVQLPAGIGLQNGASPPGDGQTRVQVANIFGLSAEVIGIKRGEAPVIPAADALASDVPSAYVTGQRSVILRAKEQNEPPVFIDFNLPTHDKATLASEESRSPLVVMSRLPGSKHIFETARRMAPSPALPSFRWQA